MGIINKLGQLLANMSEEVKQLNNAFTELNSRITKEAKYIDRMDRIAGINALKARLVREVDRIQNEERISEYAFNANRPFSGILSFAVGSITGAILKQENPFLSGYELLNKELEEKASFGTLMMKLTEGGNWEDIEVMAVSRLAREAKTSEADVISSLESKGYSLLTPEQLWKSLHRLEEDIMEGKYKSEREQNKALLNYAKKRK